MLIINNFNEDTSRMKHIIYVLFNQGLPNDYKRTENHVPSGSFKISHKR